MNKMKIKRQQDAFFGKTKKRQITEKDRQIILSQENRRIIYELIANDEGIHFQALCRKLNIKPSGMIQHHLEILLKKRLIHAIWYGNAKCFFITKRETDL